MHLKFKNRNHCTFVNDNFPFYLTGQEASETQTWLEFALNCKYINNEVFERLDEKYEHIFAKLIRMERKADSFCKFR